MFKQTQGPRLCSLVDQTYLRTMRLHQPFPLRKTLFTQDTVILKHSPARPSILPQAILRGTHMQVHHRDTRQNMKKTRQVTAITLESGQDSLSQSARASQLPRTRPRCRSAYSQLQILKNRQSGSPAKIMRSVSMLFCSNKSISSRKPVQEIERMGRLKIQGFNPAASQHLIF